MRKDKLCALKELANLQVEHIFDHFNIEYGEKYHSFTAPCPIHGGDRRDAFSWHVERGIWKCFSRGCDDKYGSDIIGLIIGLRKCSFRSAVKWLQDFINTDLSEEEIKELQDKKANRDFIVSVRKKKLKKKTYSWDIVKRLEWHNYLVDERDYPKELVEKYQIGACLKSNMYMSNRVVIPCVNADGEIVGFTGRTLDNSWEVKGIPKWKHSLGAWVEYNVFNAHFATEHIRESGCAIICEGPLDVLRLEQAGIHNGVAILGKNLHNHQLTALMNLGALKLKFALDNDAAGKIGIKHGLKMARCLFDVEIIELPEHRNDIGDMTVAEIKELFNEEEALRY